MKLKGLLSAVEIAVLAKINLKDAYIKLFDGATSANVLIVKIGEGNLTYSEKRNMEYSLDRGNLDDVREGDDVPMDVSMDFVWEYILGNTADGGSVEDFLKQRGQFASNVSTDSDACRPYAVDVVVEYMPDPFDCGDKETITLPDFRYEELAHDISAGSVSCTGRCNATGASVARVAQSSTP